MQKIPLRRR